MLDNIKAQLRKKEVLSQMHYYMYHRSPEATTVFHDMYPYNLDYYHELNPATVNNVTNPEFLDIFPAVTVRDGSVTFANWLLKNMQLIPQLKTHFFIHENQAKLLPPNLKNSFSCWEIIQSNKITPEVAKRILFTGILNDTMLDLKELDTTLSQLDKIPKETVLEIFLPQRRNPYSLPWTETNINSEFVEIFRNYFPENKIKFLKAKDILDSTSWSGTYVVDLFESSIYINDSYVNHFIAARGGTISSFSSNSRKDAFYEMDLSFHHKIQYYPLPDVASIFPDLIFHKKQATGKELPADMSFHQLLKK